MKYRDVPLREYRVIIIVNLQRFRCKRCAKAISQNAPGMDAKRHLTTRCVVWIQQRSLRASFANVAREIGCSQKIVGEIAREYIVLRNKEHRPSMPQWLGIDEVFQSGNRPYCVFSDLENRRLIDIVPNCNLRTIMAWLGSIGEHRRPRGVCIELSRKHRTAVERVFPDAEIVVDKFYLLKLTHGATDRVIRAVEERYSLGHQPIDWKHAKALLRKRKESLSLTERMSLDMWLSQWPDIAVARRLQLSFSEVYDHKNRQDAQMALELWERSVPEAMRSAFRDLLFAVKNWRSEILAYFECPTSVAYLGWPTSRITSACRLSRGCSFEVLRGRLLFAGEYAPAHHPLAA